MRLTTVIAIACMIGAPAVAAQGSVLERLDALEALLSKAVIASPASCDKLGDGWVPYADAEGRFLLGAGGSIEAGDYGGSASITLDKKHLPSHNHGPGTLTAVGAGHFMHSSRSGAMVNPSRPRALFKGYGNNYGNHAHPLEGATATEGEGKPIDTIPRYKAIHFCKFEG